MKKIALSFAITASLVTAAAAENHTAGSTPTNPTLGEIQKAFGFVPEFVKSMPDALLPGFWESISGLEMNPATKLDGKTKELIGLAVAATVPCEYCIHFHTEAAKLDGATDEEIKEAVAMAGLTRLGSTIFNGMQTDKVQFKKDVQRIIAGARAHEKK